MSKRLLAKVNFSNKADQTKFLQGWNTQKGSKTGVTSDQTDIISDGSELTLDIQLDNQKEVDELYNYLDTEPNTAKGTTVTVHTCTHEEGQPFKPCTVEKTITK